MRDDIGTHDCEALDEILELSYADLPYCLKSCYLYLGIFPEDYVIDVEVLIHLWIAEGFIRSDQGVGTETLEDVSMEFLDQLVMRCMVQVVHTDYGGKVIAIRIHDLMRDLCIKKAKFFEASSSTTSNSMSLRMSSHRAINYNGHSFRAYPPCLRSLVHFGYTDQITKEIDLPLKNMKVLRVLDLKQVDFKESLEQIGSLILLRYVSIEWCSGIKELPESIRDLRNLLTFTYKGDIIQHLKAISHSIGKLSRHLHEMRLHLDWKSGLEFDLQMLRLEDCHLFKDLRLIGEIKEQTPLGFFPPNLLCLRLASSTDDQDLKGALQQLARLRSLTLNKDSYKGSTMTLSGLPHLLELNLRKLENLKDWRIKLDAMPQLQKLYLEGCDKLERIPQGNKLSYYSSLMICLRAFVRDLIKEAKTSILFRISPLSKLTHPLNKFVAMVSNKLLDPDVVVLDCSVSRKPNLSTIVIKLWIAEGFIRSNQVQNETSEDISMEFLDQLVMRSMVQVVHRDYGGKLIAIQIHDLKQDLCIMKAKELNLFEASSPTTSDSMSLRMTSHRTII
ncbi:LOW QUALITY PROTEIN: hypothetical protein V2J09_013713 [Rumex salicifolius]